jgi:hypothetical protein
MTKGQSIVLAGYTPGHWDKECAAAIDAAIAEAVSKRTVECAATFNKYCQEHYGVDGNPAIFDSILALNAPPAPAYPFGCKCWTRLGEGGAWHRVTTGGYTCGFQLDAKHCEVCGAPRKGS